MLPQTLQDLPLSVTDYLTSERMARWHSEYLKNYRDALAYRIPLYIPPQTVTKEQGELFNALEAEKWAPSGKGKWERINAIYDEQSA